MLPALLVLAALAAATSPAVSSPAVSSPAQPLLAQPLPALTEEQVEARRYRYCLDLAATKPAEALTFANDWRAQKGGVPARHCLALAYLTQKDYPAAILAFEAAANAAEVAKSPQIAALWGQAGNAALLAGQPARAMVYFNSGIVAAGDTGAERADLHIDRARAEVELAKLDDARADVAKAVSIDPESPDGWLLTATIERSAGNLPAAEAAILKAAQYAPGDIEIAFEAGNIAFAQGKIKLARAAWVAIVAAAPADPVGIAAAKALRDHPEPAG